MNWKWLLPIAAMLLLTSVIGYRTSVWASSSGDLHKPRYSILVAKSTLAEHGTVLSTESFSCDTELIPTDPDTAPLDDPLFDSNSNRDELVTVACVQLKFPSRMSLGDTASIKARMWSKSHFVPFLGESIRLKMETDDFKKREIAIPVGLYGFESTFLKPVEKSIQGRKLLNIDVNIDGNEFMEPNPDNRDFVIDVEDPVVIFGLSEQEWSVVLKLLAIFISMPILHLLTQLFRKPPPLIRLP